MIRQTTPQVPTNENLNQTLDSFLKQIEIIENIQTDTRVGCLLMKVEIVKLKKEIIKYLT